MKFIKKFKIFESNSDDCIDIIKDILLELQLIDYQYKYQSGFELGYRIFKQPRYQNEDLRYTNICISESRGRSFVLSDINDLIESIKNTIEYYGFEFNISYADKSEHYFNGKWNKTVKEITISYNDFSYLESKTYKLFESNDIIKETVEDLLRDFSDNDIPVDVEIYHPDPTSDEKRFLILIGDEDNLVLAKDLPLYENIDNFISLNEYLIGEGYELQSIACWIKPHNEPITGQRPITITEFDKFISKIEEIEDWNKRYPELWHKTFKLIDIYYK